MTHPNQDLIDGLDVDGARFTVRANEPEAIAEAVAGWVLYQSGLPNADVLATNIAIEDDGSVWAGSHFLTDAELVAAVKFALAEHS